MHKTLVGALMLALAVAPASAFAKDGRAEGRDRRNPFASIPVSGTATNGSAFTGKMDIVGWTQDATGAINAIGVLNGTLGGMPVADQIVTWPLSLPAARAAALAAPAAPAPAGCNVLHLDLGPLSLNLLGLQVNLNEVVLDITAVPGAGNLLGNLLCAVANLLDGLAIGPILTTLLNNLTTTLAGLGL